MIDHLLNRTFEVWRPTTTKDAGGGQRVTRVNMGAVRARISQPSADEREVGQRAEARVTRNVYTRSDADVIRGDELRGGGLVLDVLGTVVPSEPVYKKCEVESREAEVGT